MTSLWLVIWFLVRFLDHQAAQLHILNVWLLTLIIAALIDLSHYRRYARRYR